MTRLAPLSFGPEMKNALLATLIALAAPLGVLASSAPAQASDLATATDMLLAQNQLRYAVGSPTIPSDGRLVAAAQAHAQYDAANGVTGHYETAGNPGYTGYAPRDRAGVQGFYAPFISEVATGAPDPVSGVLSLWDAPYHRLGMIHPNAYTIGWGRAAGGWGYQVVGDISYDFGMSTVDIVRSPSRGQSGVPTSWSGHESPSPVPAGSSGPYGYPIMAVWSGGRSVDLRGASVTVGGASVPIYIAPQQFERDYVVVVPQQPLPAGIVDVRFDVTVAGAWSTEEWTFATAGATSAPNAPSAPSGPSAPSAPAAPSLPAPSAFHAAWVSETAWPTIAVGQTATVSIAFRNTGTAAWTRSSATQANLGINGDDRTYSSLGMAVDWPVPDRPAIQDAAAVPPGSVGVFTFQVRGAVAGTYALHVRPVIDGITWMEDQGVYIVVLVR